MDYFFITGLPRSMTGWLAAFLCAGHNDIICCHDCIVRDQVTRELFDNKYAKYRKAGISDSSIPLITNFLNVWGNDNPTIIIDRNHEDAANSLANFPQYYSNEEFILDQTRHWSKKTMLFKEQCSNILVIPFEEIKDKLEDICSFLDIPFIQEYADIFVNLNIQTNKLP